MQNTIKYNKLSKKIDINSIMILSSVPANIEQEANIALRNDIEFYGHSNALGNNKILIVKRSLANFFLKNNGIDFVFPKNRHVCFIIGDNISLSCKALLKNKEITQIHGILAYGKVYKFDSYNSVAEMPNCDLSSLDTNLKTQAYMLLHLSTIVKCYVNMIETIIKMRQINC